MTVIAFTHTGAETYEQMVEMGLEMQPVHAGMSRFAHRDEAWDLLWWPAGWSEWVRISVGDLVEIKREVLVNW